MKIFVRPFLVALLPFFAFIALAQRQMRMRVGLLLRS